LLVERKEREPKEEVCRRVARGARCSASIRVGKRRATSRLEKQFRDMDVKTARRVSTDASVCPEHAVAEL
jgi:hypothetical protein